MPTGNTPDMQWWSHDVRNRGGCTVLTMLVCFCKLFHQLSCHSGNRLSVWQTCVTLCLFGLFVYHSAAFQLFGQLSNSSTWYLNRTTSLCTIESEPTSMNMWPAIGSQHIHIYIHNKFLIMTSLYMQWICLINRIAQVTLGS